MKLSEKASYLQGLMDGLDIDNSTKEGKVLKQMADIIRELILSIENVQDEVEELTQLYDTMDEDLNALESDFYEDSDDDADASEAGEAKILTYDAEKSIEEIDFSAFSTPVESAVIDIPEENTAKSEKPVSEEKEPVPEVPDEEEQQQAEEDELYEVICPTCNDTICITESVLLDGSMECPNCGEFLEFDLGGDEFLSEDAE